jgi:hypothetical protein
MSVTLDPNLAATSDPADVKTCEKCEQRFYRVKKFNKTAFARQRFCGHGCSLQVHRPKKKRKPATPKVKPVVAPKPKPVAVVPERPPWRPAGFAPQPTIRRTA